MLKPLTVAQLKEVRVLIDEAIQQNDVDLQQTEKERNNALREIGNHLHDSVPVSNDEVSVDLHNCISASYCINVSLIHIQLYI
jgi:seryl-tRNA synthetase